MDEDEIELQPQEPNAFFDGIGIDATHMDGDHIVVEVQETVFVSDVVDSDIGVYNFVPDDPDSVVIQDVIEEVVIEDVQCPDILEEADISENIIIPELYSDVTEELSLAHCIVPDDVLASDITSATMSMPEHLLTSEYVHVSDIGYIEHIVHDSVEEAEIVTDPLTTDVVSEAVLIADCASEAVIDADGIPVDRHHGDKSNCEDFLMIPYDTGKIEQNVSSGMAMDTESEISSLKVDGTCPEVIKVYIFNTDPGEDDLGKRKPLHNGGNRPGTLLVGGLNRWSNEKIHETVFGKFGPLREVLLIKGGARNKSRGFAFITFENPENATDAAKEMNGKSVDGKTINVAYAKKPSFQSWGGLPSRNGSDVRSLRAGRSGSREAKGRPLGGSGGAPSARRPLLTYGGSSRCDSYYSHRRGIYDGGHDNYCNRRWDPSVRGPKHGAGGEHRIHHL